MKNLNCEKVIFYLEECNLEEEPAIFDSIFVLSPSLQTSDFQFKIKISMRILPPKAGKNQNSNILDSETKRVSPNQSFVLIVNLMLNFCCSFLLIYKTAFLYIFMIS